MDVARQALKHLGRFLHQQPAATSTPAAVSAGYEIWEDAASSDLDGWKDQHVAERQHNVFVPLLEEARNGRPRLDFIVAARAVDATRLINPFVIEVGCGSGYYSEMLPLLMHKSLRYVGVDYSVSLVSLARRMYPVTLFVAGDARGLPFESGSCDVLFSGTSLMHIAEYRQAIAESARVTREWCVFHTVPVMSNRPTTFLRKNAYGKPVIEVIFNKNELESSIVAEGMSIRAAFDSIPYDVSALVGEPTSTVTYLCQKLAQS